MPLILNGLHGGFTSKTLIATGAWLPQKMPHDN